MPIELSDSLKSTCGWSFSSPGFNRLFKGKISTACLMTVFVIILIMIIYPCKKDTSILVLLKLAVYVFLANFAILFIHDCVTYNSYASGGDDRDVNNLINNMNDNNITFSNDNILPSKIGGDNEELLDTNTDEIDNNNIDDDDLEKLFSELSR